MITIISPAKNMKVDKTGTKPQTMPYYIEETKEIWEKLKEYLPGDLETLMKINGKLAEDSFDRIQHMQFDENGTSAVETYDGIQYKYMDPAGFSEKGKAFAQEHLRVLSGLYGVVRPYDSIYEYRLEMQTKLSVAGKKHLYDFWGDKIWKKLESDLYVQSEKGAKDQLFALREEMEAREPGEASYVILNLASEEYTKAVRKYVKPPYRMVTCQFKTYSKGSYKVLATAAKMARGSMVRYLCENQIDDLAQIKKFDWEGYHFEESLSSRDEYVFLQD